MIIIQDIERLVRKIAKTHEAQTLYVNSKELPIKFFVNDYDLSTPQIHFLNYLNFYASISMDIYLNEIDEIVLENEIYEDAYMYYKQQEKKREVKEQTMPLHQPTSNSAISKVSRVKSQWQFRRPKQ